MNSNVIQAMDFQVGWVHCQGAQKSDYPWTSQLFGDCRSHSSQSPWPPALAFPCCALFVAARIDVESWSPQIWWRSLIRSRNSRICLSRFRVRWLLSRISACGMLRNHNCYTHYFVSDVHNYPSSYYFLLNGIGRLRPGGSQRDSFLNLISMRLVAFERLRLCVLGFFVRRWPGSWRYRRNSHVILDARASSTWSFARTSCSTIHPEQCFSVLKPYSISNRSHQIAPTQARDAHSETIASTDSIPSPIHHQPQAALSSAQPSPPPSSTSAPASSCPAYQRSSSSPSPKSNLSSSWAHSTSAWAPDPSSCSRILDSNSNRSQVLSFSSCSRLCHITHCWSRRRCSFLFNCN